MKMRNFIMMVILVLIVNTYTLANRQLDRSEIEHIFQTLTSQPGRTWIPAGTIRATHHEYNESTKSITESSVILKYDGNRFYWDININSIDSTNESQDSNSLSREDFDMNWNKRRTFVWDGEKYTMYFRPGNHAIVTENPIDIPIVVNGPLTAGIIPWGYGLCSYKSLLAADSSATEEEINGKTQINLTVQTTVQEMVFVLDPAKNYAVLSNSVNRDGRLLVMTTFENHQFVGGKWIPRTITIERNNQDIQSGQFLTYDHWDFDSISTTVPEPAFFKTAYETKALVEYKSLNADKAVLYYYSDQADTELLLANRLAIVSENDVQSQNCASVAMKYAAKQLGKDANSTELSGLIDDSAELTSLDKLLQFSQQLNLYSACVKTDLASLSNLSNCQIILHLQNSEHYIVVSHIDNENVWVIDLTRDKFYYNIKQRDFDMLWGNGVALLVSNSPLNLHGNFTSLTTSQLQNIRGGLPNYSCTELIQEYDAQYCSQVGAICCGVYRTWYNRYGCEEDENGGECSGNPPVVGNVRSHCIEDPYDPGSCTLTGIWYSQYMRACK